MLPMTVGIAACTPSGASREPVTTSTSIASAAPTTSHGGTTSSVSTTQAPPTSAGVTTTTVPLPPGVTHPPEWLGTRVLPLRPDGFGEIQPTPPELTDRRFASSDLLPPPETDEFRSTIDPVPADVLARSTWREECPVTVEQIRYLTVSFWGFDERPHTGELIVNAEVADDLVEVFRIIYEARFPIEEMRVIRMDELDAPPTGDTNVTSVFECREATGGTSWSQHAYGLAVDINPFHNPYRKGEVVLPELASAYVDRSNARPGMILEGDPVVTAFRQIGWPWGGNWRTLDDWMHFSRSGS